MRTIQCRQHTVTVWDLPTRVFKWSLVLAVFLAFLVSSSHPRGTVFLVYVACGYIVTLLLIFRFVWGLVGGQYARFRSFVHGCASVRAYIQGLVRLDPPHTLGHNPVAGWMIMLLLGALSLLVLTGLLAEGKTGGRGPLSDLLANNVIAVIENIHAWLGFLIMWLVGLHVTGVLLGSLLHRQNLILTMITGRKRTLDPNGNDARGVSHGRAALLAILLAFLGAWFVADTHIEPAPSLSAVQRL